MRRLLLIVLLVLQPLQWGWANTHVTEEIAHTLSHGHAHVSPVFVPIEVAPICDLAHADSSHACHDNHTHHTTVLGLMSDEPALPIPFSPMLASAYASERIRPSPSARIERPKWHTTTSVVVSL